jgi:FMN-dependent oxidoreductase (nitrilotriacetate monooxygenase family)
MAELGGRHIRFNVNLLPGPLTDPASGGHPFIDIERYVAQARLAEEHLLDSVFLADALAVAPDPAQGFNWALDPVAVLSALTRETAHIGLIASISTTWAAPYQVARTMLSVDHLSRGRAGWNLVTTMDPSAAANFGDAGYPDRATRYRRADEFARVVSALWTSWQEDLDQPWDPGRLAYRPVGHHGEFFDVAGPLQLPASRQGTPVIFQAGGSDEGLEVAARHADGVFVVGVEETGTASYRKRLNDRARELRDAEVLVLPGLFLTIGSTEAEVERLMQAAEAAVTPERLRMLASRYGLDADALDPDAPVDPRQLSYSEGTVSVGFAQGGVDLARARPLSLRRFAVLGGGGHRRLFGTPESIADDLIGWVARGAADGYNLSVPDLVPFVEQIVPLLQQRGAYRREYTGRTLRDNLSQHAG